MTSTIPTYICTKYDSVHCTRNTITILLGKKKSEDFQGFFSKTLLIFGGRRCRSLFHLHSALRHSKLACHAVSEYLRQKIRPIFTNILVKVHALKFADRF